MCFSKLLDVKDVEIGGRILFGLLQCFFKPGFPILTKKGIEMYLLTY